MKILIVEDEPLIADLIAESLEGDGFEIAGIAGTLAHALDLAGSLRFDAAILDVNLDGESVAPVAEALRARSIPFAIMSGYSARQLPASLAGAPVLSKPVPLDKLLSMMRLLANPVETKAALPDNPPTAV